MHETDIFKVCVKTLQPSQFAQILPPLSLMRSDTQSIDQEQARIQAYKIFTRTWSAYCKVLLREIKTNGKSVQCPIFGTFAPISNVSAEFKRANERDDQRICYIPSQYLYNEVEGYEPIIPTNLSPFTAE